MNAKADSPHTVVAEKLEAPHVLAGQDHDGVAGLQPQEDRRGKVSADVDLAGGERLLDALRSLLAAVLNVGETLGLDEFLGYPFGRPRAASLQMPSALAAPATAMSRTNSRRLIMTSSPS